MVWKEIQGMVKPENINKRSYGEAVRTLSLEIENQVLKKQVQEYEALMNNCPYGCMVVQEGEIAYVNKTAYQFLGCQMDLPLIGRKFEEFLAPEDRSRVLEGLAVTGGEAGSMRCHFCIPTKRGKMRLSSELLSTAISFQGRPAAYLMIRDAGEIQEISSSILRSKAILQKAMDAIYDGVAVIDRQYTVIMINKKNLEMCGLEDFRQVIGKPCYTVFHQRYAPCPDCPAHSVLRTQKPFHQVERRISCKGKEMAYQLSIFPVFENGEVKLFVKYQRDLSRERELQEQLIHSEKLAMLGTLAGRVAHEINNPLTSIIGMAQLMASQNEGNENLDLIIKEGQRIKKLAQDLTSLSRPSKNELSDVDLNETIDAALAVVQHTVGLVKNCRIEKKYLPESPAVYGDRDQIEQVFLNLMINAAHALQSNPEHGVLTIGSKMSPDGRYVIGYVKDNGCGIAEKDKKRVFDPFFTTKKEGEGTGIGLSVAREIVLKHQGLIQFKSKVNQGTTFEVFFPLSQTDNSQKVKNCC